MPSTLSWPREQGVNRLTDLLRVEVAMAGFSECLNFALCSIKENYDYMQWGELKV